LLFYMPKISGVNISITTTTTAVVVVVVVVMNGCPTLRKRLLQLAVCISIF